MPGGTCDGPITPSSQVLRSFPRSHVAVACRSGGASAWLAVASGRASILLWKTLRRYCWGARPYACLCAPRPLAPRRKGSDAGTERPPRHVAGRGSECAPPPSSRAYREGRRQSARRCREKPCFALRRPTGGCPTSARSRDDARVERGFTRLSQRTTAEFGDERILRRGASSGALQQGNSGRR